MFHLTRAVVVNRRTSTILQMGRLGNAVGRKLFRRRGFRTGVGDGAAACWGKSSEEDISESAAQSLWIRLRKASPEFSILPLADERPVWPMLSAARAAYTALPPDTLEARHSPG